MGKSVKKLTPKVTIGKDLGTKKLAKVAQDVIKAPTEFGVKAAVGVAKPVLGGVSEVMSTPGSKELLMGGAAAFGLPPSLASGFGTSGLQPQATAYVERKADFAPPAQVNQSFSQPSNNMIYYIIAGVVAVGAILIVVLKRK